MLREEKEPFVPLAKNGASSNLTMSLMLAAECAFFEAEAFKPLRAAMPPDVPTAGQPSPRRFASVQHLLSLAKPTISIQVLDDMYTHCFEINACRNNHHNVLSFQIVCVRNPNKLRMMKQIPQHL